MLVKIDNDRAVGGLICVGHDRRAGVHDAVIAGRRAIRPVNMAKRMQHRWRGEAVFGVRATVLQPAVEPLVHAGGQRASERRSVCHQNIAPISAIADAGPRRGRLRCAAARVDRVAWVARLKGGVMGLATREGGAVDLQMKRMEGDKHNRQVHRSSSVQRAC